MKYQIAWRNWRRGEPEIRLLGRIVDPDRAAVDAGAWLGAYTFFLARYAAHVHAFEPQPECAAFLRRAFRSRVTVHACALGACAGRGRMVAPGGGASQAARLVVEESGPVEVRALDELDVGPIGFMKIDAEGAERDVLRGARRTIAASRPVLLVEIEERHLGGPVEEVFDLIASLGYRGSFLLGGRLHPLQAFSVEHLQRARLRGDRRRPYVNNFLFTPR